jgi:hypothetical protein
MIIDNFKKADGKWALYQIINRKTNWTRSGLVWNNMRKRCNPDNFEQASGSCYVGCTMSENFKNFEFFVEWHQKQIGFGFSGYEIDKDILLDGNKEYHEDKCVLVPQALNSFFLVHPNKSGLPQGVNIHAQSGRFRATLTANQKSKHIGLFETSEEASVAYQNAKKQECKICLNRLYNNDFIVDIRVIERLQAHVTNKT